MWKRDKPAGLHPNRTEWQAFLDLELSSKRFEEMNAHLQECQDCEAVVKALVPPLPGWLIPISQDGGASSPPPTARPVFRGSRNASAGNLLPFEASGLYQRPELIDYGGMGVVYKALDIKLEKYVAIKLYRGFDQSKPDATARLNDEAKKQARLAGHPNIIHIYKYEEFNGVPYFVMELVSGSTLERSAKEKPFGPRRAAELVKMIAEAVHHAHAKGVFHLDLKPSNILMTADGVPKVGDFGLSRAIDDHASRLWAHGAGTPEYMAPEQWDGDPSALREPTDVYGLGAILFEILNGAPPFARSQDLDVTRQRVLFDEPVFDASVPSSLKAICLRCLQKKPEDRYATALEVSNALDRFLGGYPVEPCSWAKRGLYRVRRHPLASAGVIVLGLLLVIALSDRWEKNFHEAQRQFKEAQETVEDGQLTEGLKQMQAARDNLPIGAWSYDDYISQVMTTLKFESVREAASLEHTSKITAVAISPDERMVLFGDEAGRTFLWDWKSNTARALPGKAKAEAILAVAFDRMGTRCASGGEDAMVNVWDVASGRNTTACGLGFHVRAIAFLGNGEHFMTATSDPKAPLRHWDTTPGTAKEIKGQPIRSSLGRLIDLKPSPRGDRFTSSSAAGDCHLWDSQTGECVGQIKGDTISTTARVSYSADGSRLIVAGENTISLYDVDEVERVGDNVKAGDWKAIHAISFSGDGGFNIVGDTGKRTILRHVLPLTECWIDAEIDGPSDADKTEIISGRTLVLSGLNTNTIRVLTPPRLDLLQARLGEGEIGSAKVAIARRASRFAILSTPLSKGAEVVPPIDKLQLFDSNTLKPIGERSQLREDHLANSVAFSPDGDQIALGCMSAKTAVSRANVMIAKIDNDKKLKFDVIGMHNSDVNLVTFSSGGMFLLSGSVHFRDQVNGELKYWNLSTGKALWKFDRPATVIAAVPSSDGKTVAAGWSDGWLQIIHADRPYETPIEFNTGEKITGITMSNDNQLIAAGLASGEVVVFKVLNEAAVKVETLEHPNTMVSTMVFDSSDRTLYVKCRNEIYRWNTTVWERLDPPVVFSAHVVDFGLIPLRRAFVAVTRDGSLIRRAVGPSD